MAGVRTTAPDYDTFAPKWKRVRDVICGQDAMHAAAEAYLPKLKNEDHLSYKARVNRSDFFNATWRTIDGLTGMAFRKPPQVDVPAAIKSYLDDITMSGVTMEGFAKECVEEVLGPGRIGVLVDHPQQQMDGEGQPVIVTVSTAQQMGLRPTLQLYTAEAIRNWKFARVNNAWTLVQVVLGETAMVDEDEFTAKPEKRYRVLDLENGTYRQRLFKVEKEQDVQIGGDIFPLMNGQPLTFIPFMLCGTQGKNDQIDEPPLIDLVDKNVAHYQVNSDYRHGLHFTGLPTPVVSGYVPEEPGSKLYIGSTAAWTLPDPTAKAYFLEFTGEGLKSLESSLSRLETQMAILGARMISDETAKQVETLGATQIKRQGENSVLAKIVQSVSETLEWALNVFAQWANASGKITYQINRDFMPALMDGRELLALVQALQAGGLSNKEFFQLMQRGDVIDAEKQFEMHQEEIKADPPGGGIPAPAKPAPTGMAA